MRFLLLTLIPAVIVGACSRQSAESLYEAAKAAEEQSDFQLAVTTYEQLADQFQENVLAESSLYRAAILANNELHDVRRSIRSYRTFHDRYPTSSLAPVSLFLSGFLYNNELHQIDSARACYQSFLNQYPTHELVGSARFELDNLGKDPSQIIPNTIAVDEPTSAPAASASKGPERKTAKQ